MDISTVSLVLPSGVYILIMGLGLLLISFFIKSPIINLAIIACFTDVLLEPAFKDFYFQSGAVLVMVYSAIAFYVKLKRGNTEG